MFVTHDQDEALSIADRIAVMSAGDIEQYSDPDDLYRHPESRFVAGFVGAMNLFEGRIGTGGVIFGAEDAFVPCDEGVLSSLRGETSNLEIAVRLEDVSIAPARGGGASGGEGRVVRQVPHGHFKEVLVELGKDASLRAYVDPNVDLSGPVAVTIRRLLAYRDGELVYESHARIAAASQRDGAATERVESTR